MMEDLKYEDALDYSSDEFHNLWLVDDSNGQKGVFGGDGEVPSRVDEGLMEYRGYVFRLGTPYCSFLRVAPLKTNTFSIYSDDPGYALVRTFVETGYNYLGVVEEPRYYGSSLRATCTNAFPNAGPYVMCSPMNTSVYIMSRFYNGNGVYPKINRDFGCLDSGQFVNRVPGIPELTTKHKMASNLKHYSNVYEKSGKSQCFNYEDYLPKTFLLDDFDDCASFFEDWTQNAKTYSDRPTWMVKEVGRHRGEGIHVLSGKSGAALANFFENGAKCQFWRTKAIVQKYIQNPMLIRGRKFDLRVYLFIASTDPIIAYFSPYWYARIAVNEYDKDDNSSTVALTNRSQARQALGESGQWFEKNAELLMVYHELQAYFLESGITSNPNYIRDVLNVRLKTFLAHTIRMVASGLTHSANLFEIIGMDFLLDTDLNVWFIESNRTPNLEDIPPEKKMVMKDIVNIVNQKVLRKKTTNEIDPGHFEPIVDYSLQGSARFFGLFKEECTTEYTDKPGPQENEGVLVRLPDLSN